MKNVLRVYHMDGYKPRWYVRLALRFVEMETWRGVETVMMFKRIFDTMYVYEMHYYTRDKYDNAKGVYN